MLIKWIQVLTEGSAQELGLWIECIRELERQLHNRRTI